MLKRPRTPEIPLTTDTLDEDDNQPTTRQYNFSMSVDELSDMEKEVNDFCNEDDDDDDDDDDDEDSNKIPSRPIKQQRTSSFTPTTTDNRNNDDEEEGDDYNTDSSSSQKLRDLILGKKPDTDSDEESLSDDDTPRGWKTNQKTRQSQS